MENILVTGAKGQLGNEIKNLIENYKFFNFFLTDIDELDISNAIDIDLFIKSKKITFIINCAAYTAVDKAENDIENAKKINILGVKNLLKSAIKNNIPIIHVSTDYVFNGKNYKPYIESDKTNPQSIYGKTKLEGEKILADYNKSLIIRTSWLYSSFGNNFVKTILKLANNNPQISVVFDQIGNPTFANDLAEAILEISKKILKKEKEVFGIFHYSNEGSCSWYDFANEIVKIKSIKTKIIPVKSDKFPRPASRPFYSILDKTKIKETFNLQIPYWRESLEKCLKKL